MSEQIENTETATILPVPVETVPVKRPRGRPKGSKNKPKDANALPKTKKVTEEKSVAPAVVPAPVATFIPDDDIVEAEGEETVEE